MPQALINELIERELLPQGVKVQGLTQGYSHLCFCLYVGDEKWFLKHYRQLVNTSDTAKEYEVLKQLRGTGISPEILFGDERGLLLPWCEGGDWSQRPLTDGLIDAVARLCLRIHGTGLTLPALDLSHLALCNMPQSSQAQANLFDAIDALKRPGNNRVPCHMDLSLNNVLHSGHVIDWEYACMSLPELELAFCAVINGFAYTDYQSLWQAYKKAGGRLNDSLQFQSMVYAGMINLAWFEDKARKFPEDERYKQQVQRLCRDFDLHA